MADDYTPLSDAETGDSFIDGCVGPASSLFCCCAAGDTLEASARLQLYMLQHPNKCCYGPLSPLALRT